MIAQLLHIKSIRADRADNAVKQQEYRVKHSASLLKKAEQSATDYQHWRIEEEERRFAKAQQKTLLLRELEDLRQEIALLRGREAELQQQVVEAQKNLDNEREVLRQKKKNALAAHKTKEKFEELSQEETAELVRQQQYQEELEQEEFRLPETI